MGKALADTYAAARRVFEEVDDALQFSISRICFEGPEDQLKLTENAQPALLTVSAAAFAVLGERGARPDFVAGHSLGEYSALVAAGRLRFADAVCLVRRRGRYMQETVPPGVGAMAALLKLPDGKLDALPEQAAQGETVSAANLNSPDAASRGCPTYPCGRQEATINVGSAAALYNKLMTATEGYAGDVPIIHQAVAVKAAIDAMDTVFAEDREASCLSHETGQPQGA